MTAPLLIGATAAHASSTVPACGTVQAKGKTIVLVHGAWHGGWCWKKVTPLLQTAGYRVLTPTLTGLGDRAHLLTPSVDLSTHIRDVSALLEYEDLRDVMLVGHSYGGMVISGVADQAGAQIGHLVYLDAFLPEDGKALKDYAPLPPVRQDAQWRTPPSGTPQQFGVTDAQDVAWAAARLGDQPTRTFTEPVRLTTLEKMTLRRSFIRCTSAPFFSEAAERAKRNGYHVREILTGGHDVMITQPEKLSGVLLQLDRT